MGRLCTGTLSLSIDQGNDHERGEEVMSKTSSILNKLSIKTNIELHNELIKYK